MNKIYASFPAILLQLLAFGAVGSSYAQQNRPDSTAQLSSELTDFDDVISYNLREAKIQSAMSAAPASIADQATIMDWPAQQGGKMTVLREGSSEWTCLPDMPDKPGNNPMCLDKPWLEWADAWMNKRELQIAQMGFGYMLQGGVPESNTDPYAEGPTPDNEWISEGVPHLMILVPDEKMLAGLPTVPDNGGPWVMWRNTPYVHIMAPMPRHVPEAK